MNNLVTLKITGTGGKMAEIFLALNILRFPATLDRTDKDTYIITFKAPYRAVIRGIQNTWIR
jgi:hypothetical protein